MSLIEVLLTYRDEVVRLGREEADKWLTSVVRRSLVPDIQDSVSDDGLFIDAYKEHIPVNA